MKKVYRSKAPTRVDLAGGTIDIWPIYLFIKEAITINLGIDLFAEAELTVDADALKPTVTLVSEDQNVTLAMGWDEMKKKDVQTVPPGLMLHLKLLRNIARRHPPCEVTLKTRARSPAGAGLGGSSALSVAIVGALAQWVRGFLDTEAQGVHFIEVVRDVETTVIQVPAGLQDYYGAMFGGLQKLKWGTALHSRQRFPESVLRELEKRLLLFYSGHSRNSGINNWALFKKCIDKEESIPERFQKISDATSALEVALDQGDFAAAGRAIRDEWETRRTLAAGISTPEIDQAYALAMKEGASAFKICGAGGGGCFFVYMEKDDAKLRDHLLKTVGAVPGIKSLPFRAVNHGLQVEVS